MGDLVFRTLRNLHLHLLENVQIDAQQASVERQVLRLDDEKALLEAERDLLRREHLLLRADEEALERVEAELRAEKLALEADRDRLMAQGQYLAAAAAAAAAEAMGGARGGAEASPAGEVLAEAEDEIARGCSSSGEGSGGSGPGEGRGKRGDCVGCGECLCAVEVVEAEGKLEASACVAGMRWKGSAAAWGGLRGEHLRATGACPRALAAHNSGSASARESCAHAASCAPSASDSPLDEAAGAPARSTPLAATEGDKSVGGKWRLKFEAAAARAADTAGLAESLLFDRSARPAADVAGPSGSQLFDRSARPPAAQSSRSAEERWIYNPLASAAVPTTVAVAPAAEAAAATVEPAAAAVVVAALRSHESQGESLPPPETSGAVGADEDESRGSGAEAGVACGRAEGSSGAEGEVTSGTGADSGEGQEEETRQVVCQPQPAPEALASQLGWLVQREQEETQLTQQQQTLPPPQQQHGHPPPQPAPEALASQIGTQQTLPPPQPAPEALASQLGRLVQREQVVVALIQKAIAQHKVVLARCDMASVRYETLIVRRDAVTAQYNLVLRLKKQMIEDMKQFKAERERTDDWRVGGLGGLPSWKSFRRSAGVLGRAVVVRAAVEGAAVVMFEWSHQVTEEDLPITVAGRCMATDRSLHRALMRELVA
ncbi:unnamed protein product [Closterium sp. Yama58-4]|nr:unnamed protein product [Closterium sp. Yama58-4]